MFSYSYNIPIIIYTKDIGEIFSWGSLWYPYFMRDIRKMGGGNVDVVTNADELRNRRYDNEANFLTASYSDFDASDSITSLRTQNLMGKVELFNGSPLTKI